MGAAALGSFIGMAPIAMGLGADASFRQPMAIGVIGGLITSTMLSLLVVPIVFTYVDGFERLLGRMVGRKPQEKLQHQAVEA